MGYSLSRQGLGVSGLRFWIWSVDFVRWSLGARVEGKVLMVAVVVAIGVVVETIVHVLLSSRKHHQQH